VTQIAAICIALLKGEVLTIADGFYKLHCTNLPRELSRSVEQKFGVSVSRTKVEFESKFDGKPGYYFRYRLNRTEYNAAGIAKMQEYIAAQVGSQPAPRTHKEAKEQKVIDQIQLF
jgi:hypothetical protein